MRPQQEGVAVSRIDTTELLRAEVTRDPLQRGLSTIARSLIGSEILRIAYEVHAIIDSGVEVLDLTVGDFSSAQFPIPDSLRDSIVAALKDGHTNYPPATGVRAGSEDVKQVFEARLGEV